MHPGGPFWKARDDGAWSIPKGEIEPGEKAIDVAMREFKEEIGHEAPTAHLGPLGKVRQAGGKVVRAWAVPGDYDVSTLDGGMTVEIEWPPRSGRKTSFPEIDRAEWFDLETARRKITEAQRAFIDRLEEASDS